jgi:hypothetical protein
VIRNLSRRPSSVGSNTCRYATRSHELGLIARLLLAPSGQRNTLYVNIALYSLI